MLITAPAYMPTYIFTYIHIYITHSRSSVHKYLCTVVHLCCIYKRKFVFIHARAGRMALLCIAFGWLRKLTYIRRCTYKYLYICLYTYFAVVDLMNE